MPGHGIRGMALENGKSDRAEKCGQLFWRFPGKIKGWIRASLRRGCGVNASDRQPQSVEFRLPHPLKIAPHRVTGGVYDPVETVSDRQFRE